eukprot:1642601-Rhodomonas_salina.9
MQKLCNALDFAGHSQKRNNAALAQIALQNYCFAIDFLGHNPRRNPAPLEQIQPQKCGALQLNHIIPPSGPDRLCSLSCVQTPPNMHCAIRYVSTGHLVGRQRHTLCQYWTSHSTRVGR